MRVILKMQWVSVGFYSCSVYHLAWAGQHYTERDIYLLVFSIFHRMHFSWHLKVNV